MSSAREFNRNDTRWIPLGYDAQNDSFIFAWVDESSVQAAFLDQRLGEAWDRRISVAASEVSASDSRPAPSWLFHTAFCCSTLLARALHAAPASIVLKEPNVLLDLARASLSSTMVPSARIDRRIREAIYLLARPWAAGGRVLIKPTNAANRLLPRLLAITPSSPALLLYGSLEDFLMSCVKKLPGAEKPMQWMAQYLLPGTVLEQRLGIPQNHALNFVESCVLVWYAQMEIYSDALAADTGDHLRSLNMSVLLAQPEEAVEASAAWLGLIRQAAWADRADLIRDVFARNSKQPDASYGPDQRALERKKIMERFGDLILAALEWSEHAVSPHARLPASWKPLLPD